jgi:hypothetical protein
MKKLLYVLQIVLFTLFVLTAFFTVQEFTGPGSAFERLNTPRPSIAKAEDFDPALSRLDNLDKLTAHCDSIYELRKNSPDYTPAQKEYPQVVSEVVRKRFYHGLSSYGFGDNYLAYVVNPRSMGMYLDAPVEADDILKFSYGICSQQAVTAMELLKRKGYTTRKVGFYDKSISGHFCYEANYNGSWHFFDIDLEPDMAVLNKYDRPGIEFLVAHPDVLKQAYSRMSPEKVMALFPTYFYGKPDEAIAGNATIFQRTTKILSYTLWILFLFAYILVHRKYLLLSNHRYVRNRRFSFPKLYRGRSVQDHPVHSS